MKLIPRTTSWNFESFELLWGAEATWSFLEGDLIVFGKRLGTLSWFLLRSWFLRQDNDLVVLQQASSFFSAWSLEAIGFTKPDDNKKVNLPLDSWRRRRRSCWRYVASHSAEHHQTESPFIFMLDNFPSPTWDSNFASFFSLPIFHFPFSLIFLLCLSIIYNQIVFANMIGHITLNHQNPSDLWS